MSPSTIPDPDLQRALSDPGFTPGRRHFAALIALLEAAGEPAELAERALRRAGAAALPAALDRAAAAPPSLRAPLTRLVGKLMAAAPLEPEIAGRARDYLVARLRDDDRRTRRMAAVALGKPPAADVDRPLVEQALAEAARGERSPDVRRALIDALGKVGGGAALDVLAELGGDDDTAGVRARAELLARRTLTRGEPSEIAGDRAPERPVRVAVRCRRGLEAILAEELAALDRGSPGGGLVPELRSDPCGGTRVEVMLSGRLDTLFGARTMLSFTLPLPLRKLEPGADLAAAVAERLLSRESREILGRFTNGAVRYRIDWAGGGKRRAAVFRAAAAVEAEAPELVNDPTQSTWDVVVYEGAGRVRVELAPRLPDPRFAYRRGDVPAASHPTIAAALARIAGARADDVVWDPFVGSGLELCERALLGPYRRLVGSDRDPRALEVARENLDAAGARGAELLQRDAHGAPPPGDAPTLILTNPPLGRRVERTGDLEAQLERFVEGAARALAPGGRLVWISPFPERTEATARRSGLRPEALQRVDMGGFDAQIQSFHKAEARPQASRGRGDGRRGDRLDPARPGRAGRGPEQAELRGEQHRPRRQEQRHDHRDDHPEPPRAVGRRVGEHGVVELAEGRRRRRG
ncbi:HEAT repeat domain-containing protein [Sorangium cellulosum]|uniref:HEAT repeat domain-containing protein n=1 Tax=Sorangium cellulosum TaxID=56 RepID=UPI000403983F|nr:HEAT repeat domain-containing protein [Sorangium cellulosum]